jgi:hypothetical protein
MLLAPRANGKQSETIKKPDKNTFGCDWMVKDRKRQRNQTKVSSDAIRWWKIENSKVTRRKHFRVWSNGERSKTTEKPGKSIFGYGWLVKDSKQQRNQTKVSSDTIEWRKVELDRETKQEYPRIGLNGERSETMRNQKKYLRIGLDGERLKAMKKPAKSIFGYRWMVKGRIGWRNRTIISSDNIRRWKIGNDKATGQKYLRIPMKGERSKTAKKPNKVSSDTMKGERSEKTKKPDESFFGNNRMVKGWKR